MSSSPVNTNNGYQTRLSSSTFNPNAGYQTRLSSSSVNPNTGYQSNLSSTTANITGGYRSNLSSGPVNGYQANLSSGPSSGLPYRLSSGTVDTRNVITSSKPFSSADMTSLGMTYGTDSQGNITVIIDGYDEPIRVSTITDPKAFVEDLKKAQEISQETGMDLDYNRQTHEWQTIYNNGTEDVPVNMSDVKDKDKFITEYNAAQGIVDSVEGANVSYNAETGGWDATLPAIGNALPITVHIEDIGTQPGNISGFVSEYSTAAALVQENGSGYAYYNKDTKQWEVSIAGGNNSLFGVGYSLGMSTRTGVIYSSYSTTVFTISSTTIQVKEVRQNGEVVATAATSPYIQTINDSLAAASAEVGSQFNGDAITRVQAMSIAAGEYLLEKGFALSRDFGFKLLGFSPGTTGEVVVVNEALGTVTVHSSTGRVVQRIDLVNTEAEMEQFGNPADNGFSYEQLQNIANTQGYEAALDYAKAYGAVNTITAYDAANNVIYTAQNVGYKDNCIALEYTFNQAYNDQVYFTDVKANDKKVLVESFNIESNGVSRQTGMVYSVDPEAEPTVYITNNGMPITAAISSLDKVTQWDWVEVEVPVSGTTGTDVSLSSGTSTVAVSTATTTETYQVARTVDFVNGEDGKPSGFEEIVFTPEGDIVTRNDLTNAYLSDEEYEALVNSQNNSNQQDSSDTNGEESLGLVDQYAQILNDAEGLKLKGIDSLYSGFDDLARIDTSRITTAVYVVGANTVSYATTDSEGVTTTITAALTGDNWRYGQKDIATNSPLNTVVVQTPVENGTFSITTYDTDVSLSVDSSGNVTYNAANANYVSIKYKIKTNADGTETYEVVSGEVHYREGTEMSAALSFGGDALSSDTVILSSDLDFSFKISSGTMTLQPEKVFISGTYNHRTENGTIQTGTLEGAYLHITESGYIGIDGAVRISTGSVFNVAKPTSDTSAGTGSTSTSTTTANTGGDTTIPDASNTNAVVVEGTNSYAVSNGTISLRDGQLVVVGNNATFQTGSSLQMIGGTVTQGSVKMTYKDGVVQLTSAITGTTAQVTSYPQILHDDSSTDPNATVSVTTVTTYNSEKMISYSQTSVANGSVIATITVDYLNPSNSVFTAYRDGFTGIKDPSTGGYIYATLGTDSSKSQTPNTEVVYKLEEGKLLTDGGELFIAEVSNGSGMLYGTRITTETTNSKKKEFETKKHIAISENGKYYDLQMPDGVSTLYQVMDDGQIRTFSFTIRRDAEGNIIYDANGNALADFEFGEKQSEISVNLVEYNGHLVEFDENGFFGNANEKVVEVDGVYKIAHLDADGNVLYYEDADVVSGQIYVNESGDFAVRGLDENIVGRQVVDNYMDNLAANDMYIGEDGVSYFDGFRLDKYKTYEEYIDAMYNGDAYYYNMAIDGLHIFQSSTAFYEAKDRGQVWGLYADEGMQNFLLQEYSLSTSDIWHVNTFVGSDGKPVSCIYKVNDIDGYTVGATMELSDGQQVTMSCGSNPFTVPEDNGEGGTPPAEVSGTTSRVSVDIKGDEESGYEITLGDTEGDVPADFDVSFSLRPEGSGPQELVTTNFEPQFTQFVAGTDIVLPKDLTIQSTNNNAVELSNSTEDAGTITRQQMSVTVDQDDTVVHLSRNTRLYDLAGAIAENGVVDGQVTVTNTLDFAPKGSNVATETLAITATITAGNNWKTADNKTFSLNGVEVHGEVAAFGGTLNTNKQIIDYGWWDGKIKLGNSTSDLSIHKNGLVRTLETVGGFVASVVGFVLDPFVKVGDAIATLFTEGFTWENLGNLFVTTYEAFTGISSAEALVDIFQNGWNSHFSNNALLNWSASMMLNKSYDNVVKDGDAGKAAVMGIVATAAIAFTIVTGGSGIAAFIPALSATTPALTGAALVASTVVTSYLAGTAAFNAAVSFAQGDWKMGLLNTAAALLTILFPVRIGGGAAANTATNTANAAANAGKTTIKLTGISGRLQFLGTSVVNGLKGSLKAISSAFGLRGGVEALRAWQGIAQHMYMMTSLNLGMNAIGTVFDMTGISDFADYWLTKLEKTSFGKTWFGGLVGGIGNSVFVESAQADSIISVNMGNSLMFATVMYATMPLAQEIMSGLTGAFKGKITIPASEPITQLKAIDKLKEGLKQQMKGFYEEQVSENFKKYILTGLGMDPAFAEYFVEYLDGPGGSSFTTSMYANVASNSNSYSSMVNNGTNNNACTAISSMFALYGTTATTSFSNTNNTLTVTINNNTHNNTQITINNVTDSASLETAMITLASIAQTTKISNTNSETLQAEVDAMNTVVQNFVARNTNINAENLMLALTASAVQNKNYSSSAFSNQVSRAYTIANQYGGFSNATFMQEARGVDDISFQGKVSILGIVSNYADEFGNFNERILINSINGGNVQAINDFVQLALLNNMSSQTGFSVNVNNVLNEININNVIENAKLEDASIQKGTEVLMALSQIGAFSASRLNNSGIRTAAFVDRVLGKVGINSSFEQRAIDKVTETYNISQSDSVRATDIINEILDIGYTNLSDMSASDLKELYVNLENMQQQSNNDKFTSLQQKIVSSVYESGRISESQKCQIISSMALMSLSNKAGVNSDLAETLGLALSLIDADNLDSLSLTDIKNLSKALDSIINNGAISDTSLVEGFAKAKQEVNTKYTQNLLSYANLSTESRSLQELKDIRKAKSELKSALKSFETIKVNNGQLQIVTGKGNINATLQDLVDLGYLDANNVTVNDKGTLHLTLNNEANNLEIDVTLNNNDIQAIANSKNKALLTNLINECKGDIISEMIGKVDGVGIYESLSDFDLKKTQKQKIDKLIEQINNSTNQSERKKNISELKGIISEITGANIDVLMTNQLAESRFNQLKNSWENGYASNFLNRFSSAEYVFNNDEIYEKMQKTLEREYKDFNKNKVKVSVSTMELAVLGESLFIAGANLEDLGKYIRELNKEYSSLKGKTGEELVQAEEKATFSKYIFEASGYTSYEYLVPRLKILQELKKSGEYDKISADYALANKTVREFISNNLASDGKSLQTNALDLFREQVLNNSDLTLDQKAMALRVLAQECVRDSGVFGGHSLRASQTEMVSSFLRGENIALGMGGGKTVAYCADAIIHRTILGQSANIEILVGNDDPANFVGEGTQARRILEFSGLQVANLNDFKKEGADTDVEGLRKVYDDANTVVVVTPTTKAHMLNEAISKGQNGQELSNVLNSVNRVLADEIHLWALTTTAAVIGGNNNPPSQSVIDNAINIGKAISVQDIVRQMQEQQAQGKKKSEMSINVEVNGIQTEIRFFNTFEDVGSYTTLGADNTGRIAIVGETSADTQIFMSKNIEQSFESADMNKGEVSSIMRGLFADTSKGGMAIWSQEVYGEQADNKVKPMGDTIQTNMVIGDINLQIGFAMKTAIERGMTENQWSDFIENSTQTSDTSMQTSLAALYSKSHAHIVGGTGTVSGLEQLIISRSGAGKVYSITGESLNTSDFTITTDSTANITEQVIKRAVNADVSDSDALKNVLLLAKKSDNIDIIKAKVQEMIENGTIQLEGDNAYSVYVFAGTENGQMVFEKGANGEIEIKIKPVSEQLTEIAKNKDNKFGNRIIISNDFGMTGIDYQGNFEQVSFDLHLMSNADAAQNIKRTGRPGGEKGRWATNRTVVYNNEEFQSQINDFKSNSQLVETARQLWSGEIAKGENASVGYLYNEKALEMMKALANNGWTLKTLMEKTNFTNADIVEFVTNIRTLYSVDQSVRFALNDSMRDRMLLSTLRDLEQRTTGADRELVSQALSEALGKGQSNADFNYEKSKNSDITTASQVIEDSFNRIAEETSMYLNRLIPALSDASAVAMAQNQLEQIETAKSYNEMETIKNKGLSDTVDVMEFMQVIKSFEEYILPMRSSSNSQESAKILLQEAVNENLTNADQIKETIDSNNEMSDDKYLTQLGADFVNLAQTLSTQKTDVKSLLLSLLFALASGVGEPPKKEEDQIVAIIKGLNEKGIRDIDGVVAFVNIAATIDESVLKDKLNPANISLSQFKNIINSKEPLGFKENIASPVTAQTAAILQYFDANSEVAKGYNDLVDLYYKKTQYRLDNDKKAELVEAQLKNNKAFAVLMSFTNVIGKSIAFLPMSAMLSVANGIFNIKGTSIVDTLKQILAIDSISLVKMLMGKDENRNKEKDNKGIFNKSLTLAFKVKDFINGMITEKSVKKTTDKVSSLVDINLTEDMLNNKTRNEIKGMMEIAGCLNSDTDKAIDNLLWLQANKPELLKNFKISDIVGLEQFTGLISLAKTDKIDLAIDKDILDTIRSSKDKNVMLSMYAPDFERALSDNVIIEQIKEVISKTKTDTDSEGLDVGYLMALKFPKESDIEKFVSRYNMLKDTEYGRYARVNDLANNKYFSNGTGTISEEYKQELLSRMPEIEKTIENNIKDITAKVNKTNKGKYTKEAVKEMLLENCAVQALNGITVVVPMIGMVEGLTKMAVEMVSGESEYEGTDSLKAAGKENTVSIGILKDMTGYEYATMTDKANITSPVIAYFDKNHVAQVNNKEDIAKIEKQGYKFTGLVLAQEGMEGLEYLSKGAEEVISKMTKGQEIGAKEKEIMGTVINGVTAPEEFNKVMDYVFAIWDKDMDKMLDYIGLTRADIKENAVETIVKASTNKMAEAVELCKKEEISSKELEVEIKLVSGLRDLLITAVQQGDAKEFLAEDNDTIKSKLMISKAVNQNVIVNMYDKSVKKAVTETEDEFVIDVEKLRTAIVEKNIKFAKDAKIDDVMELLKDGKENKFRTPLMRLSDIHAIAASA